MLVRQILLTVESPSHEDFQRQPGNVPSFTELKRFSTDTPLFGQFASGDAEVAPRPEGASPVPLLHPYSTAVASSPSWLYFSENGRKNQAKVT